MTICIAYRNALLWNVGADIIRPNTPPLSQYGKIVETAINAISLHCNHFVVDKYCIIPDNVHMTVFTVPDENGRMVSARAVSVIIGSMKRWVSKQIGFPVWQKSFNCRIIRNKKDYQEVWQYIDENSLNLVRPNIVPELTWNFSEKQV
ncbi:MAG: hypothetical protein RR009_08640, partial [Oscillospiraceae bacterium]